MRLELGKWTRMLVSVEYLVAMPVSNGEISCVWDGPMRAAKGREDVDNKITVWNWQWLVSVNFS